MSRLFGFLDCLFARRFFSDGEAGGAEGEQSTAHQELTSDGYRSEPAPTTGGSSPVTGPSSPNIPWRWVRARRASANNGTEPAAWEEYPSEHSRSEDGMSFENERFSSRESPAALDRLQSIPRSRISSTLRSDHEESGSDNDSPNNMNVMYYGGGSRSAAHPGRRLRMRDIEVIRALWHPGPGYVPREIEWEDFLATMKHLGFKKTAPARGVNYRFSVERESDMMFPVRSRGSVITAHRPHGGRTTLSLSEMREVGRRMSNLYGWSAETFESA